MAITFLIPCYNGINHTRKCVESIQRNSPKDSYNFLFIDNASTDETPRFLKSVPNSITITNPVNNYVNPAWNQGFKYLLENNLGDYVCLANNDIVAGKNWLDPIFKLFSLNRPEWYIPTHFNKEDEFKNYSLGNPLKLTSIHDIFMGFCLFFKKEHIKHFYPIPEQMKILRGDDWIIDCMTHNNLYCFKVNNCVIMHVGGATQKSMKIHDITQQDAKEFKVLCQTTYKEKNMKRIFDTKFSPKV